MTKIGFFILPNNSIKQKINNLKKKIKRNFGEQTYLNHPAHCSIYVINTSLTSLNKIKKIKHLTPFKNKKFNIEKTDIFFNDPITKKNTFYLKVKKNKFLVALQKSILKFYSKYSTKRKIIFKDKVMNKNYKVYGYPFIGINWKPHFTIASISKKKDQTKFTKDFKKMSIKKRQILKNVYLYLIKGNKHKLLCKVKI